MQHHLFYDPLEIRRKLQYPKQQDLNYSKQTQIGNWFEERQTYKKNSFKHSTSYSDQFTPKPYSRVNDDLIWSGKLKTEGIDPIVHTKYGYLDYPNYFENFSTTYDLSFNHYPQWYKKSGNISRKLRFRTMHYEPVDDYIASFNNITRSGLLEKKKEDWCEDKWRTFFPRKTHNEEVYKPLSLNDYDFPRHAPPKRNSSKLYTPNINAAKQNLRFNGPSFSVVPNFQLVQGPRKQRCDPITWECPTIDQN